MGFQQGGVGNHSLQEAFSVQGDSHVASADALSQGLIHTRQPERISELFHFAED